MARDGFLVGPVLSFRGMEADRWRVTALVGVTLGAATPEFHLNGERCGAPDVLCDVRKARILRYDLSCTLGASERKVVYGVVDGPAWSFTVPARGEAPRLAYVSCNGFSDPDGMRKLVRPANAVWSDLLANHDRELRPEGYLLDKEQLWHERRIQDAGRQRFHLLLMGGDQIYFDSIWEDDRIKALKRWVRLSRKEQLGFRVTRTLARQIEAYYFELYLERWLPRERHGWSSGKRNHDCADAMAHIPTIMMWDDHDIFDGWGSYSPEMQRCELFQVLFRHARQAFWVFQMQQRLADLPELAPVQRENVAQDSPDYTPVSWSTALNDDDLALPLLNHQPGFSTAYRLGSLALVVADLRTERSRTQVLGEDSWQALKGWLGALDTSAAEPCQHLLFMSSVPVVHPKLSLIEGLLDTFGQDHVTDSSADDLKDHWAHDDHDSERKRLLETLQAAARSSGIKASIVSGDVHVAAWGRASRQDVAPTESWHQIHQFTSSAVVHPSLMSIPERLFLHVLNSAADKPQVIDSQHYTDMLLFPGHNRYIMAARNWLAFELDVADLDGNGRKLWATWRCETETGFSNHLQTVLPASRG